LHLGEFNLRFTFTALGMLAEDVEDDRGAVNDFDFHFVFQCTPLRRCKFCICHNRVSPESCNKVG
jgi:hypothetical protein